MVDGPYIHRYFFYVKFSDDPFNQRIITRMFLVLQRCKIFAMLGVGAQANITMETVGNLERVFGCNHESFASPLNRSWPGER